MLERLGQLARAVEHAALKAQVCGSDLAAEPRDEYEQSGSVSDKVDAESLIVRERRLELSVEKDGTQCPD